MIKLALNNRGVALLMVLATILVVTILANVVLSIILNQSSLTQHQVRRIQAYYATQAGMNYALEQLRTAQWQPTSCPSPNGCALVDLQRPFPWGSVIGVNIILYPPNNGQPACTNQAFTCIQIVTQYQPTPR